MYSRSFADIKNPPPPEGDGGYIATVLGLFKSKMEPPNSSRPHEKTPMDVRLYDLSAAACVMAGFAKL
jgi:hypothetical protein